MKNISFNKIFLLFLFSLSAFTLKAQTNVSGFISANTTWDLAGSPYIVVGNALVSHGYTLTIKPGVVVKFDTARTLQIDGELIAIGASDARITFTSLQPSPKAGDWGKIHFADTCVDAVFDTLGNYVSGCIMKYCDVIYGGGIGFGEIHIESSSPYFSHCNILNSSAAGIDCQSSTYLIDSSAIKNCSSYGLVFETYFMNSCRLLIQSDTIENNIGGIRFTLPSYSCLNDQIIITNNYFLSNKNNSTIDFYSTRHLIISENYFRNNSAQANNGIIYFENGSYFTIECNKFINNQTSSMGVIWGTGEDSSFVRNNVFDGNSSTSGVAVSGFRNDASGNVYFTNNIIKNNSSPNGSCCSFYPRYDFNQTILYIDHNEFINNIANSVVSIFDYWGVTNSSNNVLYIKNNNFSDPNSKYELSNNVPYGSPDIYADSNYWVSISTQHADSVIHDYFDYGNLSVVYYLPILTAPVVIDTSCSGDIPTGVKIVDAAIYSNAFPNPFSNSTEVMFGKELRDGEVRIYNVFGQRMRVMEHLNGKMVRVERGNLSSGVYIYEVLDKQRRVGDGKLVVE